MKELSKNLYSVRRFLKSAAEPVLMLDFDGTLSPIAPTPGQAYLPKDIKSLLLELSKHFHVAIISGRELSDIKHKVGLPELIYAGNHGFKWQIGREKKAITISPATKKALGKIKKKFKFLALRYPGVLLEDKSFSFSAHYRKLSQEQEKRFLREAEKIVVFAKETGLLSLVRGKKVLEIRPNIKWGKGEFVKFLLDYLEKKNKKNFVGVYVGDDTADEDAFSALKSGITIRVGYKKGSHAKYFAKNQREVEKILSLFLSLAESHKSVKIIYSH